MKVKELKEALENIPDNAEVVIEDEYNINGICIFQVTYIEQNNTVKIG
jgi:hypothetical protein